VGLTGGPHQGVVAVSTARCARGGGGTRRGVGSWLGRAPAGPPSGAHGGEGWGGAPAGSRPKRERNNPPFLLFS
jgi:hypothetical protein